MKSSKWLNILAVVSFLIAVVISAMTMGESGWYHWVVTVMLHVGAEICKAIEKQKV